MRNGRHLDGLLAGSGGRGGVGGLGQIGQEGSDGGHQIRTKAALGLLLVTTTRLLCRAGRLLTVGGSGRSLLLSLQ